MNTKRSNFTLVFMFSWIGFYAQNLQNNLIEKDYIQDSILIDLFEISSIFPDSTVISIGYIMDGKEYFYGIERKNDAIHHVNNRLELFEIGSISKVFTSQLFAQAIEDKKVHLHTPIDSIFDFDLPLDTTVTLVQLSNHSSGLPRLSAGLMMSAAFMRNNPFQKFDREAMLKYLSKDIKLINRPNETFLYSNMGAGVLGFSMEVLYGQSYEDLIQEKILKPLHMNRTTSVRNSIEEGLVFGRDPQGKITSHWDMQSLVGAGGIYSTTSDLLKFAQFHFDQDHDIVKLMSKVSYSINDNTSVGLAWIIMKRNENEFLLMHDGGTGGFTSCLIVDPVQKRAVALLSNVSAYHPKHRKIIDAAFGIMRSLN